MTVRIDAVKSAGTLEGQSRPVESPEQFAIRVLGAQERRIDTSAIKLVGRRLIAHVAEEIAAGAPVRIDVEGGFVFGVILGCWREGPMVFAAIELRQVLPRLSELGILFKTPEQAEVLLPA